MTLHGFTDGASRGNPGESGIGLIVRDENGRLVASAHGHIGITTNNVAEYVALLTLLKKAGTLRCSRLVAHSDSELMVRQINGQYRVRDTELKEYHRKVQRLLARAPFEFELKFIPREENRDADRLANAGIESKKKIKSLIIHNAGRAAASR